jgi:hypothetical protein
VGGAFAVQLWVLEYLSLRKGSVSFDRVAGSAGWGSAHSHSGGAPGHEIAVAETWIGVILALTVIFALVCRRKGLPTRLLAICLVSLGALLLLGGVANANRPVELNCTVTTRAELSGGLPDTSPFPRSSSVKCPSVLQADPQVAALKSEWPAWITPVFVTMAAVALIAGGALLLTERRSRARRSVQQPSSEADR